MNQGNSSLGVELPSNWRAWHLANVSTLDAAKVAGAVEFLRTIFSAEEIEHLKTRAAPDAEWWVGHHFSALMGVRNRLRGAGYGEKELGVDNLDDYAVGLMELMLGITKLEPCSSTN